MTESLSLIFCRRVNIPNCNSSTKVQSFLKTLKTIGSQPQTLRVSISSCPERNTGKYCDNRFSMHISCVRVHVCVCVCVCTYDIVQLLYAFMLCKSCTLWSVGHKLTVGYSCVYHVQLILCMNSAFSVHVLYRKHCVVVPYNNGYECCVFVTEIVQYLAS